MNLQDNKFNYKFTFAVLVAIILGVLIAFYFSYAQSKGRINFLKQEKELLIKDLTLVKSDVDRLSALNEVNEIELQDSRFQIQQLVDSVGQLNFNVEKLKEFKTDLSKLEAKNDSLKARNNTLRYNNVLLGNQYKETKDILDELKSKSHSLAETEALLRKKNRELSLELKNQSYLTLENSEGAGFKLRSSKHIKTSKASSVTKLRGCITIMGNPATNKEERTIYYQFLGPDMKIIADNANTITFNGNVYSRRVQFIFQDEEFNVCDAISVPEGSLISGTYTLNIFEEEKLLSTTEFHLK
ncbi:hypothetical protein HCG49_07755 [Arenibacter sp. 6A1]|uniref:hypothetical protein n=1 Tax=Arenibacter sp. 6A1 TaxID=2720391 RepID=UPI001444BD66|nr:hypothetical protein [Arenibacter sp. 6A1]NKI26454.1 hypothetical protein [Arenibacter sp. 6A1]